MPAKQWKVERRTHCFKILCEGRKPNITIEYGDTENNIPSYGTVEEAQAVATIICHALNGTFLVHPDAANDHALVMALHAAISRRSWNEVEQAANRIRDDRRIRWPDDSHRMPATRQVFEIVLESLNYDGKDIDSLTVGEIRRALP